MTYPVAALSPDTLAHARSGSASSTLRLHIDALTYALLDCSGRRLSLAPTSSRRPRSSRVIVDLASRSTMTSSSRLTVSETHSPLRIISPPRSARPKSRASLVTTPTTTPRMTTSPHPSGPPGLTTTSSPRLAGLGAQSSSQGTRYLLALHGASAHLGGVNQGHHTPRWARWQSRLLAPRHHYSPAHRRQLHHPQTSGQTGLRPMRPMPPWLTSSSIATPLTRRHPRPRTQDYSLGQALLRGLEASRLHTARSKASERPRANRRSGSARSLRPPSASRLPSVSGAARCRQSCASRARGCRPASTPSAYFAALASLLSHLRSHKPAGSLASSCSSSPRSPPIVSGLSSTRDRC